MWYLTLLVSFLSNKLADINHPFIKYDKCNLESFRNLVKVNYIQSIRPLNSVKIKEVSESEFCAVLVLHVVDSLKFIIKICFHLTI